MLTVTEITAYLIITHASTPPLSFLQAGCPSCRPTNVKALKAILLLLLIAFSALTLLVGRQEGHPDNHASTLPVKFFTGRMPLPLTVSCFSKIQIGFTFLVPAPRVDMEKGPLNVCVCVCA